MGELYSILVVDDEAPIREGLMSLDWEEMGFFAAAQTSNGRAALKIMEERPIDVALVDIRMPVMDGIEFSGIIGEKYPDCKIILLTGYRDFEYAKSAIDSGIFKYLLKPYSMEELRETFIRLKAELDRQRSLSMRMDQLQTQKGILISFAREEFLRNLLCSPALDPDEVSYCLGWFEISAINKTFFCVLAEGAEAPLTGFLRALEAEAKADGSAEVYPLTVEGSLLVVLSLDRGPSGPLNVLGRLLLASLSGCEDVALCVSAPCCHPIELHTLYEQVKLLKCRRFFLSCNPVLYYREEGGSVIPAKYPYRLDAELLEAVTAGRCDEIPALLSDFLDSLAAEYSRYDPQLFMEALNVFLDVLHRRILSCGLNASEFLGGSPPFGKLLGELSDVGLAKVRLEKLLVVSAKKIRLLDEQTKNTTCLSVEQTQLYIKAHYSEKLSLEAMAYRVSLAPCYFSVMFKKTTGENFIDYLKKCRIEKAKELLLGTDLKIYEVSQRVGYENTKYFNDMFKEHVGTTPQKFRLRSFVFAGGQEACAE